MTVASQDGSESYFRDESRQLVGSSAAECMLLDLAVTISSHDPPIHSMDSAHTQLQLSS